MCADLTFNDIEYQKIVYDWNATYSEYPQEKIIHQLFEEQVFRTPNNIAVVFEDQQLTYAELNAQANQLARFICKQHINTEAQNLPPNTVISICLKRSCEMIIAILGILKAGGSYTPIDPRFPHERIQYIIKETKSSILLTHSTIADKIKVSFDTNIILLDEKTYIKEHTSNLSHIAKSTDLAYVMFTSGTTERPKAVMIPHKAVSRLVKNADYIEITCKDHMVNAANVSFDAATFEIWGSLLNGAKLYIVSDELLLDIEEFGSFLRDNNITILWLTSALFNQYAEKAPFIFKNLVYLLVGGEALSSKHIECVLTCEKGKPLHILNGYGPTENTVFTTTYNISKIDHNKTIPIGRPINNTSVYILNELFQPVPIGVVGEIYIGGAGLAIGYLNQPELTLEKFITNPFVNNLTLDHSPKLYKSGDRARWLDDGNIEYIDRVDFQIKHLGYRVEPNEIESLLSSHSWVKQSTVIHKESRLIAYVTIIAGINTSEVSKVLKEFLQRKLPYYMLPSAYIVLNKFPITILGKIDRQLLTNLEIKKTRKTIKPENDLEKKLSDIWSEIFKKKTISMDDNFFELGGSSLLFYFVISKIREMFGVTIKVKSLRENLTIPDLARHIAIISAVYADRVNFDDNPDGIIEPLNIKNPQLPAIYFIHPVFADCEPYKNLANSLEFKFQSIGINNYNMHHSVKIIDISTLANYYIEKIQSIYVFKEPIRLFGWSIAGKIVLEMAYHLEKQGFKDIQIYLLDTILYDESQQQFLNDYADSFADRLLKENLEPSYVEKAMDEVVNPMMCLCKMPVSGKLSYSECILFKAKETNPFSDQVKLMLDDITLPDNNLQKIFTKKIKIKNIDCHHDNIIEKTTQISKSIKN